MLHHRELNTTTHAESMEYTMKPITDRITDLINWIDHGKDGINNKEYGQYLRTALITAHSSILQHPSQVIWPAPEISYYILDDMLFFENTEFGQCFHMISKDLSFMSDLFRTLTAVYTFQQTNSHPYLNTVIAYLEKICDMFKADDIWSKENVDIAPICDELRYLISEHARDLYRILGSTFQYFLDIIPTIDNRGLPGMYRP